MPGAVRVRVNSFWGNSRGDGVEVRPILLPVCACASHNRAALRYKDLAIRMLIPSVSRHASVLLRIA